MNWHDMWWNFHRLLSNQPANLWEIYGKWPIDRWLKWWSTYNGDINHINHSASRLLRVCLCWTVQRSRWLGAQYPTDFGPAACCGVIWRQVDVGLDCIWLSTMCRIWCIWIVIIWLMFGGFSIFSTSGYSLQKSWVNRHTEELLVLGVSESKLLFQNNLWCNFAGALVPPFLTHTKSSWVFKRFVVICQIFPLIIWQMPLLASLDALHRHGLEFGFKDRQFAWRQVVFLGWPTTPVVVSPDIHAMGLTGSHLRFQAKNWAGALLTS